MLRARHIVPLLVLGLCASGPRATTAMAAPPPAQPSPAAEWGERFLSGGAPGRFDLSAALGVDLSYDSNVYNGRGPDFVVRVSPHLALGLHRRRHELALSYDLGLWTYTFGKARSSINHRLLFAYDLRATRRLTIHVADELVRAEDPGFLVRSGVVAPQTGITDNVAEALLGYRLARRWNASLGYRYRTTVFDPPPGNDFTLYDGDEHAATAGVHWRALRTGELVAGYRFQHFTAEGEALAFTHSPSLGWRHHLLRALELRVEAGPLSYHAFDENDVRWTWRGAGLLRYYTPRWRAAVSYARDLVGGTGAATVLWTDAVQGQFSYHGIQRRLALHGNLSAFFNGVAPAEPRRYHGIAASALVDVEIVRNLRAQAYYAFRWQQADEVPGETFPLRSITRHVVGLRLLAVFGAEARPPRREIP